MDIDELVEHWTLLPDELDLALRRHDATRLVFAVWLKFYTRHGRFPWARGAAGRCSGVRGAAV